MLFSYDKTLGTVETSQGTMTLTKVFIPFFLEMFLMNFMQTVNTFMLSYFSDNAVAAVGAAGQFSSMIYVDDNIRCNLFGEERPVYRFW